MMGNSDRDVRAKKKRGRRLPHCFPPISTPLACVLILGSFPGIRSLEQAQYYAHPRNGFWKIMASLLGFAELSDYVERVEQLKRHRIALWDVLHGCRRVGSLDSAIEPDSIVVNDFKGFFAGHPHIKALFFNGCKAESEFVTRVLPTMCSFDRNYALHRLPSTSPAMASLSLDQKREAWRLITAYL